MPGVRKPPGRLAQRRPQTAPACAYNVYMKNNDQRIRDNLKRFANSKVEYCPPSNWCQSEYFGQGCCLNQKQIEKRRRRALWQS